MANRNTKRARKQGLSNRPWTIVGTGEKFMEEVPRPAQDNTEFKGQTIDTAWNAKGSKRKSPRKYKGMDEKSLKVYREQLARV